MKTERNPKGAGRKPGKKYVMLPIAVTVEEKEAIDKAHDAFVKEAGVKISRNQYLRSLLPKKLFK